MERGRMRIVKGIVVKNSSDKTIMVQAETRSKNKKIQQGVNLEKEIPCP